MDKVVQSNASNAEESASASEELSAQAESVKTVVNNLAQIVGGSSGSSDGQSAIETQHRLKTQQPHFDFHPGVNGNGNGNANKTGIALKKGTPSDLIPLDSDFGEF